MTRYDRSGPCYIPPRRLNPVRQWFRWLRTMRARLPALFRFGAKR